MTRGPRSLYARLAELERAQEQARRAREASENARNGTAGEAIKRILEAYGIERLPKESWFETTARALGIRASEMKAQILARTFRTSILNWIAAREAASGNSEMNAESREA
jgi:hypothetical protein